MDGKVIMKDEKIGAWREAIVTFASAGLPPGERKLSV